LLRIFPKVVVIPVVALNDRREIVAFTYVKLLSKLSNSGYSALGGIVVIEGYRGMGLGYKVMLLRNRIVGRYRIDWIWTWILASNVGMLSLANKLGYKVVGKTRVSYKGLGI
jgi:GNAT superfamily N-acetyltransferase